MPRKSVRKPPDKTKKIVDEEEHFKKLFEYAPISLWEQDFSGIKSLFDGLHLQGIR